jgi:isopenicillin N synthase-like dioxygenase
MGESGVPLIDLRSFYEDGACLGIAREVDEALRRIGFFVIKNHAIPSGLLQSTTDAARRFFDLPLELKSSWRKAASGSARGYQPPGQIALSYTQGKSSPPDLLERFGIGPEVFPEVDEAARAFYQENVWPTEPPDLRAKLLAYYQAMESLSRDLLTICATGLGVSHDFFIEKFQGHNSTLRLNNYPEQHVPAQPGQLRAGSHTDYGLLTILMVDNALGGLQVRTRAGEWVDVQAPPESFVINIGDMMMYWTNDRWLSNFHRVVNPPVGSAGSRRQSIAFFVNPREDVLIECIETCIDPENPARHPPVIAGQHRLKKIRAAGDQKAPAT